MASLEDGSLLTLYLCEATKHGRSSYSLLIPSFFPFTHMTVKLSRNSQEFIIAGSPTWENTNLRNSGCRVSTWLSLFCGHEAGFFDFWCCVWWPRKARSVLEHCSAELHSRLIGAPGYSTSPDRFSAPPNV